MRPSALWILALIAGSALAADIYSWRDQEGRIHYSDVPPPAPVQARSLGIAGPAPAAAATPRRSVAEQELQFRKRREQAAEAAAKLAKEQAQADERRIQCEQARSYLATLESGRRIVRYNAAGEQEILDDARRGADIERSRATVAAACG